LPERGDDVPGIALSQPVHLSTTPLHLRQNRTRPPFSSRRWPTRVGSPHSGQTICTFDALSGASRSTIPPLTFFCGSGLVRPFTNSTPSTTSRPRPGSARSTRPRLPRSRPAITMTLSFFRIDEGVSVSTSEHLRRQRDDLHETPLAQLARHRP